MMKCKGENENESGMLEYLEDIIGTSRYKVILVDSNTGYYTLHVKYEPFD